MKKEYVSPLTKTIQTLPFAFICASPTSGEREQDWGEGGSGNGSIDNDDEEGGNLSRKANFWE